MKLFAIKGSSFKCLKGPMFVTLDEFSFKSLNGSTTEMFKILISIYSRIIKSVIIKSGSVTSIGFEYTTSTQKIIKIVDLPSNLETINNDLEKLTEAFVDMIFENYSLFQQYSINDNIFPLHKVNALYNIVGNQQEMYYFIQNCITIALQTKQFLNKEVADLLELKVIKPDLKNNVHDQINSFIEEAKENLLLNRVNELEIKTVEWRKKAEKIRILIDNTYTISFRKYISQKLFYRKWSKDWYKIFNEKILEGSGIWNFSLLGNTLESFIDSVALVKFINQVYVEPETSLCEFTQRSLWNVFTPSVSQTKISETCISYENIRKEVKDPIEQKITKWRSENEYYNKITYTKQYYYDFIDFVNFLPKFYVDLFSKDVPIEEQKLITINFEVLKKNTIADNEAVEAKAKALADKEKERNGLEQIADEAKAKAEEEKKRIADKKAQAEAALKQAKNDALEKQQELKKISEVNIFAVINLKTPEMYEPRIKAIDEIKKTLTEAENSLKKVVSSTFKDATDLIKANENFTKSFEKIKLEATIKFESAVSTFIKARTKYIEEQSKAAYDKITDLLKTRNEMVKKADNDLKTPDRATLLNYLNNITKYRGGNIDAI